MNAQHVPDVQADIGISPQDHALIGRAAHIPVCTATPIISVSPLVLPAPDRIVDLQMRVSAPVAGSTLPIILLSHGQVSSNNLSSLHGYGPLADFWAAHGFVVIQPTHLSSKTLNLDLETPGAPTFWRSRVDDMSRILDQIEIIEASVPGLAGRLDRDRIAVAGHSMGGHTAGMLLGARLTDPDDGMVVDKADRRIKAGVMLAAPGDGGAPLNEFATKALPFFCHPSFIEMTTPTLVNVGDKDASKYFCVRGPTWHADPYTLSTGPKSPHPCSGANIALAVYRAMMRRRPPTEILSGWRQSNVCPGHICAARPIRATPLGRWRAQPSIRLRQ